MRSTSRIHRSAQILEQVEQNRIRIYEFPDCDSDEDDDFKKQDADLKVRHEMLCVGVNCVLSGTVRLEWVP